MLCPDLLLKIFLHLDVVETTVMERTCKVWRRLCTRCSLAERIQLCCYYTKATAQEDVLGIGITVSYHEDGNIKEVGTELDVISAGAFYKHHVRRGAWGNDFAHFLPLVLDVHHARYAVPLHCAPPAVGRVCFLDGVGRASAGDEQLCGVTHEN